MNHFSRMTTLLCFGVGVALLAVTTPAQAGLAPSKASQLVTLNASGATCTSGLVKVDTQVKGDGTTTALTIPAGMVLVITGAEWDTGGGAGGVDTFFINLEGAGTATVHVAAGAVGSSGLEGGGSSFSSGIVVKPGTNICVGLNSGKVPIPIIHGFLAKDK